MTLSVFASITSWCKGNYICLMKQKMWFIYLIFLYNLFMQILNTGCEGGFVHMSEPI